MADLDWSFPVEFTHRGSTLYLRKRVPRRFKPVEEREYVWLSLHTDSETVAKAKHARIWTDILEAWEARLAGADEEGEGRMRAARDLAAQRGFPRYADSPSLSDTINKYLIEIGLLESPKHSLYSLRHSMEDRMLAAGFDERIRRDILGHALQRERYGSGGQLAQVHALISSIAL